MNHDRIYSYCYYIFFFQRNIRLTTYYTDVQWKQFFFFPTKILSKLYDQAYAYLERKLNLYL